MYIYIYIYVCGLGPVWRANQGLAGNLAMTLKTAIWFAGQGQSIQMTFDDLHLTGRLFNNANLPMAITLETAQIGSLISSRDHAIHANAVGYHRQC
jgi:hypothetical protein